MNEGHTTAHTDVHYLKADTTSLSNLQLDYSAELFRLAEVSLAPDCTGFDLG